MKTGFYAKLAADGMKKNRRLYLPYIITGCLMIMMFYILCFLSQSNIVESMRGGSALISVFPFGAGVVGIFSLIFLFYTNSFLIKQRNHEFGLYNVLGIDKKKLCRIILWESIFIGILTIIIGLILGVLFSKLAELGMLNLMDSEVIYDFSINTSAMIKTVIVFGCIYFLLLLNSIIKIHRSNPLELIRSGQIGEKPPKGNWLFTILGIIALSIAYYLSVTIKQPLSALEVFFIAVILVIAATYLLFISGSVVFCRLLKRNKNYYYKPNHFISVSSMVYRMKRNGASLANICILLTMTLVMISSTASLYFGNESIIKAWYPNNINCNMEFTNISEMNDENILFIRNEVEKAANNSGNIIDYRIASIAGVINDNGIMVDINAMDEFSIDIYESVGSLFVIPLSDYNKIMKTNEVLTDDECMLYCNRTEYKNSDFSVSGDQAGKSYKVKKILDDFFDDRNINMVTTPSIGVVVNDFDSYVGDLSVFTDQDGKQMTNTYYHIGYNVYGGPSMESEVGEKIDKVLYNLETEGKFHSYRLDERAEQRKDMLSLYGGLFFLGILLSIVFLVAAVLIIYYKQISEGYEDQSRFEIMKKVGMTKREIHKSINSQVLTVFFLPLIFAGIHLAFAFPIVWKLLMLFNLNDLAFTIIVTSISFILFGLLYVLVYKITSNSYYSIVSGRRK